MSEKTRTEQQVILEKFIKVMSEPLRLDNEYEFKHILCQALESVKRWSKYARMNREMTGSSAGQSVEESVLEHTVHTLWDCMKMVLMEKHYGGSVALELRESTLFLAAFLHDLGEGLGGDKALKDKTLADVAFEDSEFARIAVSFAPQIRNYLMRAYRISQEGSWVLLKRNSIEEISVEGRFFWAVEVIGYLQRALHEVSRGHTAFANTFHNMQPYLNRLSEEFYSFRVQANPVRPLIESYKKKFPYIKE